jgi:hypothetical protein
VRKHLTYANVVSTLCLFIVLGGGAFAATKLPKNSVTSTQIKNGSIKGPDVAKSAITSVKVKNGSLLPSDFKASALHGLQGPTGPQGPAGKNAATNVVVRIAHAAGTNSAAVACAPGERAVGGGGLSGSNADGIAASFPLTNGGMNAVTDDGQVPDGWSITSGQTGAHTAYVLCVSP